MTKAKNFLSKVKSIFITLKVIAQRVGSYISLLNISMILFLTLSDLKTKGYINIDIGLWIIPLYITLMIAIFVLGYFELYVFKGCFTEQEIVYKLTPIHPDLQDMKRKVDEMYQSHLDYQELLKDNTSTLTEGKNGKEKIL